MKLHQLAPAPGSRRHRQRVGRGIAAGRGKTSGRGQKGQHARSSVGLPVGFEGGQLRLSQRVPKLRGKLRGFYTVDRTPWAIVNVAKLRMFEAGTTVDVQALAKAGLIARREKVKLLGIGRVRVPLTVRVHRSSAAARRAIEAVGGSLEVLDAPQAAAAPRQRKARKKVTVVADSEEHDGDATEAKDQDRGARH